MYNLNNKLEEKGYKFELYKAREAVLLKRIEKLKKTIYKLQNGLDSMHLNESIRKKFESKIAEESETALGLVKQLKDFRNKYSNYLAS